MIKFSQFSDKIDQRVQRSNTPIFLAFTCLLDGRSKVIIILTNWKRMSGVVGVKRWRGHVDVANGPTAYVRRSAREA